MLQPDRPAAAVAAGLSSGPAAGGRRLHRLSLPSVAVAAHPHSQQAFVQGERVCLRGSRGSPRAAERATMPVGGKLMLKGGLQVKVRPSGGGGGVGQQPVWELGAADRAGPAGCRLDSLDADLQHSSLRRCVCLPQL